MLKEVDIVGRNILLVIVPDHHVHPFFLRGLRFTFFIRLLQTFIDQPSESVLLVVIKNVGFKVFPTNLHRLFDLAISRRWILFLQSELANVVTDARERS